MINRNICTKLTTAGMNRDSIWSKNECMRLPGTMTNLIVIKMQFMTKRHRLNRKKQMPIYQIQSAWYEFHTSSLTVRNSHCPNLHLW